MNFFKKLFGKNTPKSTRNIPNIEPIVVQAVEGLLTDVNAQKDIFEVILEFKKDRKGISDLKTILALLYYSNGDLEIFRKSAWQSHPHFWMDEISHIFRSMEDAEEWVKTLSKPQK